MIVGLGVELVDAARFESLLARFGQRLRARLYTEAEQAYAASRGRSAESLAVRWAAKVAARRALGLRSLPWRDVEVVREGEGAPALRFHRRAAAAAQRLGVRHVALSLSHEAGLCIGHVVLEDGE